ncbi:MAG: Zn-dependent hydrolase [Bacteroidales bacterium]|nr:Zn-dependent hydrolase [Bacteroidales bacterium]
MKKLSVVIMVCIVCLLSGCKPKQPATTEKSDLQIKTEEFVYVDLTSDLVKGLSENDKQLLSIFFKIGEIMDNLFWKQTFGDKTVLDTIQNQWTKEFVAINYGPWERLNDNQPFIAGFGFKPAGCQFYPQDMTKDEFLAFNDPNKESLYTVIQRNADGSLKSVWYHEVYKEEIAQVCALLDQAIAIATDEGMKTFLIERKKSFETDDYFASDMAWMDMKQSFIDFVVGPIENYDDKLNEAKASYESFILIRDVKKGEELGKFIALLPELQKILPGEAKYKTFVPGTSSDLNVYDAVYYAGDCNAGSKTIAINLPNDDRVNAQKGTRRLQLRNAMQAKFDHIMMPIGKLIIEPAQQKYLKFDAFFWNVMLHEVSHGLGVKNTITGKGSVDKAMQTEQTSWEEAKADVLGLFLNCYLIEKGEITNISVEDALTTYVVGILRSVRFGASSSHGKANMMCYNCMEKGGAIVRNADGTYHIDFDKARKAMEEWGALILKTQGDGDYDFAVKYRNENGIIGTLLQKDLDKINTSGIPKDIRFNQGAKVLGIE